MKALATGGYFDQSGDGVVWQIDLATERADVVLRWTPPEHLRVPPRASRGGASARTARCTPPATPLSYGSIPGGRP